MAQSPEPSNPTPRSRPRVLDLLDAAKQDGRPLRISAPMVRYSKLPFRLLVRNYGADVIFTPMMLAHEFVRSPIARDSDFTTHPLEQSPTDPHRPALIAQFAASDPDDFARAAALIAPWVDGIDLNCGCPQSWAIREGIGCALQDAPELVARMVRAARVRVGPGTSLSVKIRIDADGARTARWLAVVQDAGVDFVTVHGRLRSQRSSTPPDYAAVRALRDGVRVPLFANGDAYSLADVRRIADATAADGVMAARGILENPALCAGYETVPEKCLGDFLAWVVRCPIPFPLVLHHVSEMTGRMSGMTKMVKRELMECKDLVDLIDFVDEKFPGARVRRGEGDGLIAF